MYFGTKSYLKSNHYQTAKHPLYNTHSTKQNTRGQKVQKPPSPPHLWCEPLLYKPSSQNSPQDPEVKTETKKTLIMEISSITLSFPKPPPCLPFSSSQSTFFNTTAFFNKSSKSYNSLVLGKTRSRSQRAKKGLTCNALFGLGVPELVVIAGVATLLFGPKQLPEVGRSIGKTVKSFQQVSSSFWYSLVFKW